MTRDVASILVWVETALFDQKTQFVFLPKEDRPLIIYVGPALEEACRLQILTPDAPCLTPVDGSDLLRDGAD